LKSIYYNLKMIGFDDMDGSNNRNQNKKNGMILDNKVKNRV